MKVKQNIDDCEEEKAKAAKKKKKEKKPGLTNTRNQKQQIPLFILQKMFSTKNLEKQ